MGMAIVAIGVMPSSLGSLFSAPNDNKSSTNAKCLMAKGSNLKVTPTLKLHISSTPSLLDCVEEINEMDMTQGGFAIFVRSLQGDAKMAFESLMRQLGEANSLVDEHEERIFELEGFARDDAEKISELEEVLVEKEELKETIILDLSKMKDSRDHALSKLKELMGNNEILTNGHNELLKDFELLEKAHKALSCELKTLKESHDNIQPNVLNANACATNPLCVKASLIEENFRLKAQLEKGLATCIQGEKNLNDLLSNQKRVVGKEGLGFSSSSMKANKKRTPSTNDITFVKKRELANEELEFDYMIKSSVTSGTPTHNNFAGKYNPSYVLLKSNDGHVYARYVGTSYCDDYHHAIWVPKTLVTNKKGPNKNGDLKSRN